MQQQPPPPSPSFLRNWRRKSSRPQTSPSPVSPQMIHPPPLRSANTSPISPPRSPSDSSTRFFRVFRSNNNSESELDDPCNVAVSRRAQKPVSIRPRISSPHIVGDQPISPPPPIYEQPLPALPAPGRPPTRPPRPPSLDLFDLDVEVPRRVAAAPRARAASRRVPELDNVWSSFMRATKESSDSPLGMARRLNASNPALTSNPRLQAPPMHPGRSFDGHESDTDTVRPDSSDFALSLFPTPPPLRMRRLARPAPLILQPTPSLAPLPPSPGYSSSSESTPVATPTTPRSSLRNTPSPNSILKKSPTRRSVPLSPPSTPPTPTATPVSPRATRKSAVPRLRSAQSVPHLQPMAHPGTHRNTSSDTYGQKRRLGPGDSSWRSIPEPHRQGETLPYTAPAQETNVEWFYAI